MLLLPSALFRLHYVSLNTAQSGNVIYFFYLPKLLSVFESCLRLRSGIVFCQSHSQPRRPSFSVEGDTSLFDPGAAAAEKQALFSAKFTPSYVNRAKRSGVEGDTPAFEPGAAAAEKQISISAKANRYRKCFQNRPTWKEVYIYNSIPLPYMEDFDIRDDQEWKGDKEVDKVLRPLQFADFAGQPKVLDNLEVFVQAARKREEALDHVLLHGPPGLGKTTLSHIISNELGVGIKVTSGPVLDKPGDLAGLLTNLQANDVLFIDEIHRLSAVVEEYLYSAMEDYKID
ncbi:MAG: hypothetical protein ACI9YL_000815, partial [Luteibaculaceae bacterium]